MQRQYMPKKKKKVFIPLKFQAVKNTIVYLVL